MRATPATLILAWGNPGRGDDAAGLAVADALQDEAGAGVVIRSFHQLGPELAEDIAAARLVIFIDAHERADWPDLLVRRVERAVDYSPDSHSSSPEELLALADVLYHSRPEAWLVSPRAFDTTFGAGLSAQCRPLVARAAQTARQIIARPSGRREGL